MKQRFLKLQILDQSLFSGPGLAWLVCLQSFGWRDHFDICAGRPCCDFADTWKPPSSALGVYFNRKLRGSLGPALNREIGLRAWLVQAGNAKLRVRARCRVFLPILASAVGSSASPRGLMAELRKWCARWFEDRIGSNIFFL